MLIYCVKAHKLSVFGRQWVFPKSIRLLLQGWNRISMQKGQTKMWNLPTYLFWFIWEEHGIKIFKEEEHPDQELKEYFFCFYNRLALPLYTFSVLGLHPIFLLGTLNLIFSLPIPLKRKNNNNHQWIYIMAYRESQEWWIRSIKSKTWVLVKLLPQPFKSLKPVHKGLMRWYEGPFPILGRVGKVSYKVELPPRLKIHPIFHAPYLKGIKKTRTIQTEGYQRGCL